MGVKSESKWRRAVVLRIRGARVKAAAGKVRKDQASGKVISYQLEQCTHTLDVTMHSNSVRANQKNAKTQKCDFAAFIAEKRLAKNPRP